MPRLFTPLLQEVLVAKLGGLGRTVGVLALMLGGLVLFCAFLLEIGYLVVYISKLSL